MNTMKIINNFLLFLFCFTFINQIQAEKVSFSSTDFATVKQQAIENNRPYFAYFTASWCMPCRMMDETTWQDPNLAKYIDENYYAVKIDVDNFDGYVQKEEIKVELEKETYTPIEIMGLSPRTLNALIN